MHNQRIYSRFPQVFDFLPIKLQQKPGPQNPVFLPSDGGHDWLLAKIWVRSADFQYHQLASHFLRTHMMAELFCGATLRHLPHLHPLHQVYNFRLPPILLHLPFILTDNCVFYSWLYFGCLFSDSC